MTRARTPTRTRQPPAATKLAAAVCPTTEDGKRTTSLPALREPAHVALGAALDERELRAAVGTRADEVLRGARLPPLAGRPCRCGNARLHGSRRGRPRAAQEVLLDALLLLHPFFDRDADRVGHREHFVRPEADDPIGGDAPQLAVHLAQRDP